MNSVETLTPTKSLVHKTGIFPLTEADKSILIAHYLRLSADDRRLRFGILLKDEVVSHIVEGWQLDHCSWGIFLGGALRGSAILMPLTKAGNRAEFAITLEKNLQGHGWGTTLTNYVLHQAALQGVAEIDVQFLQENRKMLKIAQAYPGGCSYEHGECVKHIDIPEWSDTQLNAGLLVGTET